MFGNVFSVEYPVFEIEPSVRVFFSSLVLAFQVDDVDSVASCEIVFVFNFIGIFDQFSKPSIATGFEVDPVVEDEVCLRSLFDIFWKRFVLVRIFADRNDTVQIDLILSNIFSYICKDGVGGDHFQFTRSSRRRAFATGQQTK